MRHLKVPSDIKKQKGVEVNAPKLLCIIFGLDTKNPEVLNWRPSARVGG